MPPGSHRPTRARIRIVVGLAAISVLAGRVASAPELDRKIDFARDVYPILQRACLECHGPEKQRGKLRLDRPEAIRKAVVPGKVDESELIRRITKAKGTEGVMPARGEPLAKADVATLREWVRQGAAWPADFRGSLHWAYRKPTRPDPPAIKDKGWAKNAVDHFILSRLEKEGLKPSPEADRAVLLRRVSLDLIGLPPTPKEVDEFVADKRPDGYERQVDRLLSSPQFGERWARPWLDLARYADSHGFQRDDLREMWAYRDWVIKALNDGMSFDRFTIEQLAGDLLPDATEAQKIATGFHRCSPINVEAGSEPEESRVNQVIDRVNTTATVWLGTTLECAQCHDHKYDPFTQKDYYGLFAFFNGTAIEADRADPKVPGSIRFLGPRMSLKQSDDAPERARLGNLIRTLNGEIEGRRKGLIDDQDKWERELAARTDQLPQSHILEVADFASSAGSPHKTLEDGSILLVDDPPDKDTYTVTVHTKLRGITGFKVEALTDPSLPGNGPGRGDARRPNFVLSTFGVTVAPPGKEAAAKAVKLTDARASFSQANFAVAGAIDDDAKTAWAINPKFGQPHWATFAATETVGFDGGTVLTFRLVQEFGAGRAIGRLRLSAMTGDLKARAIPGDVVAALRLAKEKRTAAQQKLLLDYRLTEDVTAAPLVQRREQAERDLQAIRPLTTLVMQELTKPRSTAVMLRGDYRTPGDRVEPRTPEVLHPLPKGAGDRLALAQWLIDPDNPLVARVTVNRWWAELFGHGLVRTLEDFGVKGERPTHPELLDWLAVEFVKNGWSMKKTLRVIVTSATYRQSSRLTKELLARDDQNNLHARGPRFRLDAETIRDNALAVSGLLSLKQYGPPIRPYQPDGLWTKVGGDRVEYIVSPGEERHRRGIYVVWKRASPYPSFVNFDATARLACTTKRSRSNTPLQALTLLNDPVYVEAAKALAKRVLTEKPDADLDAKLTHAFRLCVARSPREAEVRVLQHLYESQRESYAKDARKATELIGDFAKPAKVAPEEFAAWYAVATALLNLDETIAKG